jgi:hypothetical protein
MEALREALVSHLRKHTWVTVVSVAYIHRISLNRSRTYVSSCAIDHIYVVKPWEKGNALGLYLNMMV